MRWSEGDGGCGEEEECETAGRVGKGFPLVYFQRHKFAKQFMPKESVKRKLVTQNEDSIQVEEFFPEVNSKIKLHNKSTNIEYLNQLIVAKSADPVT